MTSHICFCSEGPENDLALNGTKDQSPGCCSWGPFGERQVGVSTWRSSTGVLLLLCEAWPLHLPWGHVLTGQGGERSFPPTCMEKRSMKLALNWKGKKIKTYKAQSLHIIERQEK